MKKKWLAVVPALALVATPLHLQQAEAASENEVVQSAEIPPELKPILDVASEHQPTLQQGSASIEVELVQVKLSHFGFDTNVDGLFGPNTSEQVRAFQSEHELAVDGIVGVNTWTELLHEERKDQFTVEYAIQLAEQELDNDDLVFSSNGELHEDSDGQTYYHLRAQSQDLIDGGGTGTVGFYNVYNNGDVVETDPK